MHTELKQYSNSWRCRLLRCSRVFAPRRTATVLALLATVGPLTVLEADASSESAPSSNAQHAGAAVENPEQRRELERRVQGRWSAIIAGDLARAYSFELPSYRQLFGEDVFRVDYPSHQPARAARVESVKFDHPDVAAVQVRVTYAIPVAPGAPTESSISSLEERWLSRGDVWWHVTPFGFVPAATDGADVPPANDPGQAGAAQAAAAGTGATAENSGARSAGTPASHGLE